MSYSIKDVTALEEAIKSGALRVTYKDRTVQYNSLSELKILRMEMLEELDIAENGPKKKRKKIYRMYQSGTGY